MPKKIGLSHDYEEDVRFEPAGEVPKSTFSHFYRGEHCNFNPYVKDFLKEEFLEHFILKGHLPDKPIILKSSRVTTFGSCFAVNIAKHLENLKFNLSKNRDPAIYISQLGEGLVNVHSLRTQFEWALEGAPIETDLWHGPQAELFRPAAEIRERTAEILRTTDVFIITLGLSEIWYDEVTNGVFWRAVPMKNYDPSRHKFRVCTHAETLDALRTIYQIIRKNTKATIIFTLSPIPLMATFRDQSCITANSSSKAILRSALDEWFRTDDAVTMDKKCFYFPAYEMVSELFPFPFKEDGRHPHDFIIEAVMKIFEAFYCKTSLTKAESEQCFKDARNINMKMLGADPAELQHAKKAFEDAIIAQNLLKAEKSEAEINLHNAWKEIENLKTRLRSYEDI